MEVELIMEELKQQHIADHLLMVEAAKSIRQFRTIQPSYNWWDLIRFTTKTIDTRSTPPTVDIDN